MKAEGAAQFLRFAPEKSAMIIAIFSICSWKSGTPNVRSSTGFKRSSK